MIKMRPTKGKTNRLLNEEAYNTTYQRIKCNYGRQIVKDWTEKTDPNKYVYEDCGIAAFLLELWQSQGIGPRLRFADIGCGNGLLVHLLAKEGFSGVGLDVRRRRIWSLFQAQGTDLQEVAIDPSSAQSTQEVFNGIDFLIGNHSDELTPWIPVIAARLGCNFFLLPCCPYNFFSKFMKRTPSRQEINPIVSVSEQFYAYIEGICFKLGFKLLKDDLRIPSRKKRCFIGIVPEQGLVHNMDEVIEKLLSDAQIHKTSFTPRTAMEAARNCTNIPLDARLLLTKRIVDYLINMNPEEDINGWRSGGSAHLSVLSREALTPADRELLSNQDKGLQTFIRNQHQVFSVESAIVSIRKWPLVNAQFTAKAGGRVRNANCWFLKWHPDGCPFTDGECSFKH